MLPLPRLPRAPTGRTRPCRTGKGSLNSLIVALVIIDELGPKEYVVGVVLAEYSDIEFGAELVQEPDW